MKIHFNHNHRLRPYLVSLLAIWVLGNLSSCEKIYKVPESVEYLSDKLVLGTKDFTPVLGRNNLISGALNAAASSTPLNFEIVNFRNSDGSPSDALSTKFHVKVWVDDYTGQEASIEEIEAKRRVEERPIIEVRKSADFIFWPSAKNNVLVNYQGSVAPAQSAGYLFDVKVSNSGGERILKDFTLRPFRERSFEPSMRNAITGLQTEAITPTITSNITGVNLRRALTNSGTDSTKRDVRILVKKNGTGNSLTFKFLDKDFKPIDPNLFNLTNWDKLVHGFNKEVTKEFVRYNVAYPIPLTSRPTVYTSADGSMAKTRFGFWRLGFNGVRVESFIDFNFQIFEEGDWEIAVQFRYDTPKFSND